MTDNGTSTLLRTLFFKFTPKILVLVCLALLSGCKSKPVTPVPPAKPIITAYISAVLDPNYTITPQSRVSVNIPTNAPIETRRIAYLVTTELQTNGFKIVQRSEAQFILLCTYAEKTTQSGGYDFQYTAVFLNAYAATDSETERNRTIWEGRVVQFSDEFNKAPERYIRTLVQFLGKNFKGDAGILP
jgi:hypothetical protein